MGKLVPLIVALGLFVGWFGSEPQATPEPPEPVSVAPVSPTPAPPPKAGNGAAEVVIDRAPDGHFYTDAQVNGASIRFIIDTGATTVALNRADAQAAGLQFAEADFTERGRGVSGDVMFKRTKLDRVAIGPVATNNVDAVILEGDANISLLGQSWLRQVRTVTIEGDRMILK